MAVVIGCGLICSGLLPFFIYGGQPSSTRFQARESEVGTREARTEMGAERFWLFLTVIFVYVSFLRSRSAGWIHDLGILIWAKAKTSGGTRFVLVLRELVAWAFSVCALLTWIPFTAWLYMGLSF